MRVVIRADASLKIGHGHVMRCLALVAALQHYRAELHFIACDDLPEALIQRATRYGCKVHTLSADLNEIDDAQACAKIVAALGEVDWVVLDHYGLGLAWEQHVAQFCRHVLVLDDLERVHHCDLLLDQNYGTKEYAALKAGCSRLFGPRFALLREEFNQQRMQGMHGRQTIRRILVSFGGSDPDNQTAKALQALCHPLLQTLHVDVVIASTHPQRGEIENAVRARGNAEVFLDCDAMALRYQSADLALGAAGVSALERCSLGLPSILLVLADNQRELAQALAEDGYALSLGEARAVDSDQIAHAILGLQACPSLLATISKKCFALCDAKGAQRVAKRMAFYDLQVWRAEAADCKDLWQWRNHPDVRRYSIHNDVIAWDDHQTWFAARLQDPNCLILIVSHDQVPVGVVRFDMNGNSATVSIYLVPNYHGQGLGTNVLDCAQRYLKQARPDIKLIHAQVKHDNIASRRIFADNGYHQNEYSFVYSI